MLLILLLPLVSAKNRENLLCRSGKRLNPETDGSGRLALVEVSKVTGGVSWLASFGETYVRIESTESPIRVLHGSSRLETEQLGESYFSSIMSSLFDEASKTFSGSWSPFEDHFIRVKPQKLANLLLNPSLQAEEVCYITRLRMISLSRVAPLIVGLLLFFNAKRMSRNVGFHYAGGITSGIALAAFVALFLLARLLPMKRSILTTVWLGGSSLLMWFGSRFRDQVLELLQAYPWIFSIYIVGAAGFSYCICFFYEDQLRNPKIQKLTGWLLQLIGLGAIMVSSWKVSINIAIVTILLAREFTLFTAKYVVDWKQMSIRNKQANRQAAGDAFNTTPKRPEQFFTDPVSTPRSNFFSPLRIFERRKAPQSVKKFLTQEEYEEQGRRETEKQLQELQKQIKSSPDPLKLMSKLSKGTVHKVINFSLNGEHINDSDSDEELTQSDDERNCAFDTKISSCKNFKNFKI